MNIVSQIKEAKTAIGIELGSTRIKAVLIGENYSILAAGTHDWNNCLENGIWTYSLDSVKNGLQSCFGNLIKDIKNKYNIELENTSSIGISAMMHGYLAFDGDDNLLVPFRTWRNTMTEKASDILTEAFGYNIPQRWSIAHLYQAVLNKEPHVSQIKFMTTLAGYVHWLLTGNKVLGIGDASGMFPIDPQTKAYYCSMLSKFNELVAAENYDINLKELLPEIVEVGECAGKLTEYGANLLDPSGKLKAGVSLCPPEGDAQTGMVATNSILPRTGNVSAGTSIFAMTVLEKDLSCVHKEIDTVCTPCGDPVAMVHCNNCTTDLDSWINLFNDVINSLGFKINKPELYDKIYEIALSGEEDCDGIISYNYYSGEHVTGFSEGRPLLVRSPLSQFNLANLSRSVIYSCLASLKIGMDILLKEENVALDKMYAHGGLFKSPITGQRFLAAALDAPVMLMETAGEGGAWGIAILAAYQSRQDRSENLNDYINNRVFKGMSCISMKPDAKDICGFNLYINNYKAGLAIEKSAVSLCIK